MGTASQQSGTCLPETEEIQYGAGVPPKGLLVKIQNFTLSSFSTLQALLVSPCRASTYASMGYVYSLTGKAAEAVEYFQKALALKRDDTFSTTMLNFVLDSYLSEAPPFPGAPAEVPAPKTPLPTGLGLGSSRNAVKVELPATISSSNMEMSNVSMADISEEENPQMDTPDSVYGKPKRQFIRRITRIFFLLQHDARMIP